MLKKRVEKDYKNYRKEYYAKKLHLVLGMPLEFQVWCAAKGETMV